MGVPVVGKRHHGKANTSQSAVGKFGTISKRISGMRGGGRSSVNNQQSFHTQEPAKNNTEHSLGTLSPGGTPSQGDLHTRRLSDICKELEFFLDGEISS